MTPQGRLRKFETGQCLNQCILVEAVTAIIFDTLGRKCRRFNRIRYVHLLNLLFAVLHQFSTCRFELVPVLPTEDCYN